MYQFLLMTPCYLSAIRSCYYINCIRRPLRLLQYEIVQSLHRARACLCLTTAALSHEGRGIWHGPHHPLPPLPSKLSHPLKKISIYYKFLSYSIISQYPASYQISIYRVSHLFKYLSRVNELN